MWTVALIMFGLIAIAIAAVLATQDVGPSEYRRTLARQGAQWGVDSAVIFTGAYTSGATTITGISSDQIKTINSGMALTGPNLATATVVDNVIAAGSVTISTATLGAETAASVTGTLAAPVAEVHLFQAAFAGGSDPAPSDFVECDFDTYAYQSIASVVGPYTNQAGVAEMDTPTLGWVLTSTPVVGNDVYGYWIDYPDPSGAAGRVVALWETFPTPIPMRAIANAVSITIPITAPLPSAVGQP